jgi:hypothetical protein
MFAPGANQRKGTGPGAPGETSGALAESKRVASKPHARTATGGEATTAAACAAAEYAAARQRD